MLLPLLSLHGSHSFQVSLAIGFLFLGGGKQTFSTSNSSIAALLITLYPRLPNGPNDNRCHLQVTAKVPYLVFWNINHILLCIVHYFSEVLITNMNWARDMYNRLIGYDSFWWIGFTL